MTEHCKYLIVGIPRGFTDYVFLEEGDAKSTLETYIKKDPEMRRYVNVRVILRKEFRWNSIEKTVAALNKEMHHGS